MVKNTVLQCNRVTIDMSMRGTQKLENTVLYCYEQFSDGNCKE